MLENGSRRVSKVFLFFQSRLTTTESYTKYFDYLKPFHDCVTEPHKYFSKEIQFVSRIIGHIGKRSLRLSVKISVKTRNTV